MAILSYNCFLFCFFQGASSTHVVLSTAARQAMAKKKRENQRKQSTTANKTASKWLAHTRRRASSHEACGCRCGLRGTRGYRPIRRASACCVCGLEKKSRAEGIGAAVTRDATSKRSATRCLNLAVRRRRRAVPEGPSWPRGDFNAKGRK